MNTAGQFFKKIAQEPRQNFFLVQAMATSGGVDGKCSGDVMNATEPLPMQCVPSRYIRVKLEQRCAWLGQHRRVGTVSCNFFCVGHFPAALLAQCHTAQLHGAQRVAASWRYRVGRPAVRPGLVGGHRRFTDRHGSRSRRHIADRCRGKQPDGRLCDSRQSGMCGFRESVMQGWC